MITIRLRLEIATPSGETVQSLPILPGDLMIPGLDQIFSASVEQVDVNGQPYKVKGVRDPRAPNRIRLSLLGAANDLTDGAFKALVVDIIEEAGEEPRKEAPLLTES